MLARAKTLSLGPESSQSDSDGKSCFLNGKSKALTVKEWMVSVWLGGGGGDKGVKKPPTEEVGVNLLFCI